MESALKSLDSNESTEWPYPTKPSKTSGTNKIIRSRRKSNESTKKDLVQKDPSSAKQESVKGPCTIPYQQENNDMSGTEKPLIEEVESGKDTNGAEGPLNEQDMESEQNTNGPLSAEEETQSEQSTVDKKVPINREQEIECAQNKETSKLDNEQSDNEGEEVESEQNKKTSQIDEQFGNEENNQKGESMQMNDEDTATTGEDATASAESFEQNEEKGEQIELECKDVEENGIGLSLESVASMKAAMDLPLS